MNKVIIQSREQFEDLLNILLQPRIRIAVDIETSGTRIYNSEICGIGFATSSRAWYIPFRHEQDIMTCDLFESFENCPIDWERELYETIDKFQGRMIFFNGVFDIKFMKVGALKYGFDLFKGNFRIWDTAVVEHLLTGKKIYSSESVSTSFDVLNLVEVANSYGIQHKTKKNIKKLGKHGYHKIPIDLLGVYCMEDCEVTYKIFEHQYAIASNLYTDASYKLVGDLKVDPDRNKGLIDAINLENYTVLVAADISMQGWKLDLTKLDEVIYKYQNELAFIHKEFSLLVHDRFNPNSHKDIVAALEQLGVDIQDLNKHERITNFKKVARYIKKRGTTLVKQRLNQIERHRELTTVINKYKELLENYATPDREKLQEELKVLTEERDKLHTCFEKILDEPFKKLTDKYANRLLEEIDPSLKEVVLKTDSEALKALFNIYLSKLNLEERLREKIESGTYKEIKRHLPIANPISKILLFIKLMLLYRKKDKLYSTYLVPMKRDHVNGILYGDFNPIGTETGRFSSEHPNLQNIANDKDIKDVFIVPEGYIYLYLDYSNMEMRVAAHYSGETGYRDALNNGLDGHKYTGSLLFDKPMEEVTGKLRKTAKMLNFLLIYGGGVGALANRLGIDENEARHLYNKYFERMPALARFKKKLEEFVKIYGYVKILHGRVRWLRARHTYKAFNTLVQGGCAMFVKNRVKELWDALKPYKSKIIGLIHDEVVIKVPYNEITEILELSKKILGQSEFEGTLMPITVGLADKSWGEIAEEDNDPERFKELYEKYIRH